MPGGAGSADTKVTVTLAPDLLRPTMNSSSRVSASQSASPWVSPSVASWVSLSS